jgi:hypothetical protein
MIGTTGLLKQLDAGCIYMYAYTFSSAGRKTILISLVNGRLSN